MCMNKSIVSPEFMSGALRSHKLTTFSRGAYSAPPQTPSCSYGSLRSSMGPQQKITHPPPPQRDKPTVLCPQPSVANSFCYVVLYWMYWGLQLIYNVLCRPTTGKLENNVWICLYVGTIRLKDHADQLWCVVPTPQSTTLDQR